MSAIMLVLPVDALLAVLIVLLVVFVLVHFTFRWLDPIIFAAGANMVEFVYYMCLLLSTYFECVPSELSWRLTLYGYRKRQWLCRVVIIPSHCGARLTGRQEGTCVYGAWPSYSTCRGHGLGTRSPTVVVMVMVLFMVNLHGHCLGFGHSNCTLTVMV